MDPPNVIGCVKRRWRDPGHIPGFGSTSPPQTGIQPFIEIIVKKHSMIRLSIGRSSCGSNVSQSCGIVQNIKIESNVLVHALRRWTAVILIEYQRLPVLRIHPVVLEYVAGNKRPLNMLEFK